MVHFRSSRVFKLSLVATCAGLVGLLAAFDAGATSSTEQTPAETPNTEQPPGAIALTSIGAFASPVEIATRASDHRIFVIEQAGLVIAVDDQSSQVILDITDLTSAQGERGLLGAAFHPAQPLLYVHYNDHNGDSILAEYQVNPDTGVADPTTSRVVLAVDQPYDNHNGGELTFGPDGFLYLGLGDGGLANDPNRAALDLTSPLGKILRLDPMAAGGAAFTVPEDSPFIDIEDAEPAIWSYGLRNPWKFSFDPANGDLWIADVGQDLYEEINHAEATPDEPAGRALSFGWSAFEGTERFNLDQPEADHKDPVLTYARSDGRCSISGGAVYRGELIPNLDGYYVFGDYCTGEILAVDTLDLTGPIEPIATMPALVAIAAGPDNELYAVSATGDIARIG